MTSRSIGILLGAAALVAAASFALGTEKKSERRASPLDSDEPTRFNDDPEPEAASTTREASPRPNEPEVVLTPQGTGEDFEQALADAVEEELEEPTVRERHLPVIRAIRENHANPEARKEAMLKALRTSGPTSDPWSRRGREVFETWEGMMPKELDHAWLRETVACYQAGCEIAVRFPTQEDAEKGAQAFRELEDKSSELHAGRVQTPAVEVGAGMFEASWILLRPEGS